MIITIDLRKVFSFIGLLLAALFFMWSFSGWYTNRQIQMINHERAIKRDQHNISPAVPKGIKNRTEWNV